MTIDLLFLAKNRLEYTRQALHALLANTNWGLVRTVGIYDYDSTDGTLELIAETHFPVNSWRVFNHGYGSPAAVMNSYVRHHLPADVFAKIDNDTIVPPGWLDQCAAVMEAHPELDLLGIEPPESRVPHFAGGKRNPQPELTGRIIYRGDSGRIEKSFSGNPFGHWGYAPCDSIGGIGLMRTA